MAQSILLISFQPQLWKLEVINSISLSGSKNVWKTVTELSNCRRIFIKRSEGTDSFSSDYFFLSLRSSNNLHSFPYEGFNSSHSDFKLVIVLLKYIRIHRLLLRHARPAGFSDVCSHTGQGSGISSGGPQLPCHPQVDIQFLTVSVCPQRVSSALWSAHKY